MTDPSAKSEGVGPRLLSVSVGVSDEALQRIGLVMVMAAGLDYRRMTLLERAVDVSVKTSASWNRRTLKKEVKKAFSQSPFDRLLERVQTWLSEVDKLLELRDKYAHSVTYYEVRGDGSAGSFSHHPKSGERHRRWIRLSWTMRYEGCPMRARLARG